MFPISSTKPFFTCFLVSRKKKLRYTRWDNLSPSKDRFMYTGHFQNGTTCPVLNIDLYIQDIFRTGQLVPF